MRQLNRSERPFLVNPVGTGDVSPEELIGLRGFVAEPRGSRGHRLKRGRVIIDLFGLNLRHEPILERCNLIRAMWPYLERHRTGNPTERDDAARELDALTRPSAPHASCARCFRALYESDRAAARECYDAAARNRSERLPE